MDASMCLCLVGAIPSIEPSYLWNQAHELLQPASTSFVPPLMIRAEGCRRLRSAGSLWMNQARNTGDLPRTDLSIGL